MPRPTQREPADGDHVHRGDGQEFREVADEQIAERGEELDDQGNRN